MKQLLKREYIDDALRYSSNRRKLFIHAFSEIREKIESKQNDKDLISTIIEFLHSSASIIDDIQDNEGLRKGMPTYYMRNGYGTSAFAALRLWHESLKTIVLNYDLSKLLPNFENLLTAQEADTGLIKRDPGITPLNWYFETVSKKISEELLIVFKLCNPNFENYKDELQLILIITDEIGRIIQFIDDKKDVIDNDILSNQHKDFIFTYSFPYALLLEESQTYEKFLNVNLDRNTAEKINKLLKSESISISVSNHIESYLNNCQLKINKLNSEINCIFNNLIEKIKSDYWEEEVKYAKSIQN